MSEDMTLMEVESRIDQLKEMARNVELSRIFLYSEIANLERSIGISLSGEKCFQSICSSTIEPMPENRFYVHLKYEGMLPLYSEDNEYKRKTRQLYNFSTEKAISSLGKKPNIKNAFVYIVHIFPDLTRRDYDNRGRKFLLDALRYTGVIEDDNWRNIQIAESGLSLGLGSSRVEVFVCDVQDKLLLIEHIDNFYVKTLSTFI